MRLGTTTKTTVDIIRFEIDYVEWLAEAEFLTTYEFASDPLGLTMSGAAIALDGNSIAFLVGGGLDGEVYNLLVTISTDAGQTRQDYVVVTVSNP